MVLLQLEHPLELFVKRRKFVPGSRFQALPDMTQTVAPKAYSFTVRIYILLCQYEFYVD